MKLVKGCFEVSLIPQSDDEFSAGRMTIDKRYQGEVEGLGTGQMISKRLESGVAIYFAIEEFCGCIEGKKGSFTLLHKGYMDKSKQSLEVTVLEGSGSDELANISGSMNIIQEDGKHLYEFNYHV